MRSSTCWRNSTRSHAVTRPCAPTDPARSRPSPSGTRPCQGARRRRRSRAQKPPKAAEPLAADHRHGVPPADRGRLGTKRVAGGHRHRSLGGASDVLASEVGAVAGGRGGGRLLDSGWPVRGALLATHPIGPTRVAVIVAAPLTCGNRRLPQVSPLCRNHRAQQPVRGQRGGEGRAVGCPQGPVPPYPSGRCPRSSRRVCRASCCCACTTLSSFARDGRTRRVETPAICNQEDKRNCSARRITGTIHAETYCDWFCCDAALCSIRVGEE